MGNKIIVEKKLLIPVDSLWNSLFCVCARDEVRKIKTKASKDRHSDNAREKCWCTFVKVIIASTTYNHFIFWNLTIARRLNFYLEYILFLVSVLCVIIISYFAELTVHSIWFFSFFSSIFFFSFVSIENQTFGITHRKIALKRTNFGQQEKRGKEQIKQHYHLS